MSDFLVRAIKGILEKENEVKKFDYTRPSEVLEKWFYRAKSFEAMIDDLSFMLFGETGHQPTEVTAAVRKLLRTKEAEKRAVESEYEIVVMAIAQMLFNTSDVSPARVLEKVASSYDELKEFRRERAGFDKVAASAPETLEELTERMSAQEKKPQVEGHVWDHLNAILGKSMENRVNELSALNDVLDQVWYKYEMDMFKIKDRLKALEERLDCR